MTDIGRTEPVRTLICEDEPLARRALSEYLADVEWVDLVGMAEDGNEALRLIHKLEPGLVFLDIRMPEKSGLVVLENLSHKPAIVFTTAYPEYALPAFEWGAVDYLMKPFGRERLLETLQQVRVRLRGEGLGEKEVVDPHVEGTPRLFASHRGSIVPVPSDEILRIDATPTGISVVTDDRTFQLHTTLAEILDRLDPRDFVRIHRSHVVNLNHVKRMRRYDERRLSVSLADGTTLVASRSGSQRLRELMG